MSLNTHAAEENQISSGSEAYVLNDEDGLGWIRGRVVLVTDESAEIDVRGTSTIVPLNKVDPAPHLAEGGHDDMSNLEVLVEGAVQENVHVRYMADNIYTAVGPILISVNPYKKLPIYGDNQMQGQTSRSTPHIFHTAESAYQELQRRGTNQFVLISGESGAGKTEATKLILRYLTWRSQGATRVAPTSLEAKAFEEAKRRSREATSKNTGPARGGRDRGRRRKSLMVLAASDVSDQILQSNPVLEAFGNAKTVRNNNSSRFGKLIQIQLNASHSIVGAAITTYLLEKSRVVSLNDGERNYHVFYQMCAGASEDQRQEWQLKSQDEFRYLSQGGETEIDSVDDASDFMILCSAMDTIGIDQSEQSDVFRLLAGILHIGNLTFAQVSESNEIMVEDATDLQLVASLLGIPLAQLESALLKRTMAVCGEQYALAGRVQQASDSRDALAKQVYTSIFHWLVSKINKNMDKSTQSKHTIGVLDLFGFECFQENSFEQLCINYANEKLHQHFLHHFFKLEVEEYQAEGVCMDAVEFVDNAACIELIEERSSGILSLLEEECGMPQGTDANLLQKMTAALKKTEGFGIPRIQRSDFFVEHFAGAVTYKMPGFVEKNRDTMHPDLLAVPISRTACPRDGARKQEKGEKHTQEKEETHRGAPLQVGVRPVGSARLTGHCSRGLGAGGGERCGAERWDLDPGQQLLIILKLGTLTSCVASSLTCSDEPSEFEGQRGGDALAQVRLLERGAPRYSGLLDIIRIRKFGYAIRLPFATFLASYWIFDPSLRGSMFRDADPRIKCSLVLRAAGLQEDQQHVFIGKTKIFLKSNETLNELDAKRQAILSSKCTAIQAFVRMTRWRRAFHVVRARVIFLQAQARMMIQVRRMRKHNLGILNVKRKALKWISQHQARARKAREAAELRQREEARRREEEAVQKTIAAVCIQGYWQERAARLQARRERELQEREWARAEADDPEGSSDSGSVSDPRESSPEVRQPTRGAGPVAKLDLSSMPMPVSSRIAYWKAGDTARTASLLSRMTPRTNERLTGMTPRTMNGELLFQMELTKRENQKMMEDLVKLQENKERVKKHLAAEGLAADLKEGEVEDLSTFQSPTSVRSAESEEMSTVLQTMQASMQQQMKMQMEMQQQMQQQMQMQMQMMERQMQDTNTIRQLQMNALTPISSPMMSPKRTGEYEVANISRQPHEHNHTSTRTPESLAKQAPAQKAPSQAPDAMSELAQNCMVC
ncbi:hypothetical protein CYMTET_19317 [Cymbomonas tetramitiformis]|uniref:Myosin motor domain-containing protein n=1 Tax=Cymbomonas tetramitiformis TaxID=36881 RepID=A0AAE0L5B3_9CHLO|nr:hypothetical protein CYMTET_19317 [Cymbomonas tetramitiformis]